jgi:ATP-dependent Lon protease
MTGEVTLRGDVLPIGGLGEKLLAARREGIKTVLIPKENEKDLVEISDVILKDLTIVPVDSILEALPIALRDRGESDNKPTVAKTKKTVQKK